MKESAAKVLREVGRFDPAPTPIRRFAANFWLNYFYWHAEHLPRVARSTKWFYLFFALTCSKTLDLATAMNARRIFGDSIGKADCRRFKCRVVSNFFNFIYDVGLSLRLSPEQLVGRIDSIDGQEKYTAARSCRRGAIIASIHMGSFEAAAASLRQIEPQIHVLFKRDNMDRFERIRTRLRRKLGINEVPLDDGWGVWVRLRDALAENHVVMLQADRVMQGQKGQRMKFLHGHLLLPTGPIRLAMATGAPIIPIVTTRTPKGRVQIHIEDAICVGPDDPIEIAMNQVRDVIEKYVRTYPEQWLMLEPAFCEDQA
ncbi:MAG TPA: lysophospholipid acyltransferase family protein [Tepidisphaeraceae bacterium]|nr:lysophospholipid acyltransferase family protein [Tepidisphaeraceae bacterium]